MIELTADQEKKCVELFAQGLSREEVVNHLIDTEQSILDYETEHGAQETRKQLSDKLRTCDPSNPRFAIKKHGEHYETHREALMATLTKHYQIVVAKSVRSFEAYLQDLDDRIEELQTNVSNAMETAPVGASEYLATHNMILNLEKRKMEVQDKFLERLERIAQQGTSF